MKVYFPVSKICGIQYRAAGDKRSFRINAILVELVEGLLIGEGSLLLLP